jgi:D-arginine dehydrogenase
MTRADIIVIGAGIAGASMAAELAQDVRVLLLEMERQPGYHATGRSAAMYAPAYGPAPIRALTRASGGFFRAPCDGFIDGELLSPRDTLFIATPTQEEALEALRAELAGDAAPILLNAQELIDAQPLLRAGYASRGLLDRSASEIDVDALHQGYLRRLRVAGGELFCHAEVTGLQRENDLWHVTTRAGAHSAPVVVNAAGAWAELVGEMAGAERIGLVPKRRTVLTVEAPEGVALTEMPLTVCAEESFYLKPDAGRLLISPANEDPENPCDVQPDELDIAFCIDRIERAFSLNVTRVESKWAGLRSFVADKCPVVGFSDKAPGFFWLAGQGGYGIQTAPALSRLAAALVLADTVPEDILAKGVSLAGLAPGRLQG